MSFYIQICEPPLSKIKCNFILLIIMVCVKFLYLNITPREFFETEIHNPEKINTLLSSFRKLNDEYQDNIIAIVQGLAQNKKRKD